MKSMKQFKPTVVKVGHSENVSCDANVLAQMESDRIFKEDNDKKSRMDSFMNSTKLNASKLYKEKQLKNVENMNVKKVMLEKQKQLKAKYTIVDKKWTQFQGINVKPTIISKKIKKINIPEEKQQNGEYSDSDASGMDSEYEINQVQTPTQLIKKREDIRSKMLNKGKNL